MVIRITRARAFCNIRPKLTSSFSRLQQIQDPEEFIGIILGLQGACCGTICKLESYRNESPSRRNRQGRKSFVKLSPSGVSTVGNCIICSLATAHDVQRCGHCRCSLPRAVAPRLSKVLQLPNQCCSTRMLPAPDEKRCFTIFCL